MIFGLSPYLSHCWARGAVFVMRRSPPRYGNLDGRGTVAGQDKNGSSPSLFHTSPLSKRLRRTKSVSFNESLNSSSPGSFEVSFDAGDNQGAAAALGEAEGQAAQAGAVRAGAPGAVLCVALPTVPPFDGHLGWPEPLDESENSAQSPKLPVLAIPAHQHSFHLRQSGHQSIDR